MGQLLADPAPDTHTDDLMDFSNGYPDTSQGSTSTADVGDELDWTSDNLSFAQGGPSWNMEFDHGSLQIQGL
jgi:hypothetical protein